MCTEIWSNESIDLNVPDFQQFCLHRQKSKNSKRDSNGIIIYIKDTYVNDTSLFFQSEDDMLWIRLDGNSFFHDNDLFIGLCYVVPESSGRFNSQVQNIFDRLLNSILLIHNYTDGQCYILLSGDFNSRTSDNPDCIDSDLDNDSFYYLMLIQMTYYVHDFLMIKVTPIVMVMH